MSAASASKTINSFLLVRPWRIGLLFASIATFLFLLWKTATLLNLNPRFAVGQEIDRLNGVAVFYNGGVGHSSGRNLAPDGYNLGLKYQCVEFVKRYYYEHLGHKMPDPYGHAKQFFDASLPDGTYNPKRDLLQFTNGSQSKPSPDDLIVFGPSLLNRYGHVAIVSEITDQDAIIVQQNPGPFGLSRERLRLKLQDGRWYYQNSRILGWLRKMPKVSPPATRSTLRSSESSRLPLPNP